MGERVDVRYAGENLASFLPHITGYFKIYVSDYQGPILGSPFYVLIHPHEALGDVSLVETSGIGDSIRGEETKFTIQNKNSSDIDVQIKSELNIHINTDHFYFVHELTCFNLKINVFL